MGAHEGESLLQSGFHIVKSNIGTGIFLLSTFYRDSGLILGLVFVVLCGIATIDTTLMLLSAKRRLSIPHVNHYPEVACFIFGHGAKMLVDVFLVMSQMGFCLLYTILISNVLGSLVSFTNSSIVWMCATSLVVFPLTFLSGDLRILSFVSGLATICVSFCILVCLALSGMELQKRDHHSTMKVSAAPPSRWIVNISSNIAVLEGIGLVLSIHSASRSKAKVPRLFQGVLSGIVALYILFGALGYAAFGEELTASIFTVLPSGNIATVTKIAFIVELCCTYVLQLVPVCEIFDALAHVSVDDEQTVITRSNFLRALAVRGSVVAVILGLAIMVGPDSADIVVSIIGSISATSLAFILPPLLRLASDYAADFPAEKRGWAFFRAAVTYNPTRSSWNPGSPAAATEHGVECQSVGAKTEEAEDEAALHAVDKLPATGLRLLIRRIRAFLYVALGLVVMVAGTATSVGDAVEKIRGGGGGGSPSPGGNSTNSSSLFFSQG